MANARKIAIGLLIHFCMWWALSTLLWIGGYGAWIAALLSPLAPILLGVPYLRLRPLWQIGAISLLASISLVLLTWLSLRRQKRWLVIVTHGVIVIYWFMSFAMIAAET